MFFFLLHVVAWKLSLKVLWKKLLKDFYLSVVDDVFFSPFDHHWWRTIKIKFQKEIMKITIANAFIYSKENVFFSTPSKRLARREKWILYWFCVFWVTRKQLVVFNLHFFHLFTWWLSRYPGSTDSTIDSWRKRRQIMLVESRK